MSFRHDKIRGKHPITPRKGIKESNIKIKEKGNNDRITISVKPQSNEQKRICTKCGLRFFSAGFVCPDCGGKALLARHSQHEVDEQVEKTRQEQLIALREGNVERMSKISQKDREKVWEAIGGVQDINSLNFEDSKKLWMEHGKYPYEDF